MSCSSEVEIQDNHIALVNNYLTSIAEELDRTRPKPNIEVNSVSDNSLEDLEQLETEFLNIIEKIEVSDTENRRDLFYQFLTYADKLDGGPAEIYFYFVQDYVTHNAHNFFEVLTIKDLTLINDWAKIAAEEIILYEYNEGTGQRIFNNVSEKIRQQTTELEQDKIHLVDLYLENLNEHWYR